MSFRRHGGCPMALKWIYNEVFVRKILQITVMLMCSCSGFAAEPIAPINEKEVVQSLEQVLEAVDPENTGSVPVATSWLDLSEPLDNNDSFIDELSLGLTEEDSANANAIDAANGFAATRAFARTRCAMIQLRRGANCSGHIIGSAMVTGRNYAQACVNAKRMAATGVPRGCQLKHCMPCTYN